MIELSHGTARAVAAQMGGGRGVELTILMGEGAKMPGFCADEAAMLARMRHVLGGGDPEVSRNVRRHLGDMTSNPVDVAILASCGLDVAVAAYQISCMGALKCRARGIELQITGGGPPRRRLTYDIQIGPDATWTSMADGQFVMIHNLPDTVAASLQGMTDGGARPKLSRFVQHPALDAFDLHVSRVSLPAWGGAKLVIERTEATTDAGLADLLDGM